MRHLKKALALLLAIVMAMSCITAVSAAETGSVSYPVTGGSILFDPQTGTVTGYEGSITEANIPSSINGVKVVAIGDSAFVFCDGLISVTIPDGVLTIGSGAFSFCDNLVSVTIPDSVLKIDWSAFAYCPSLVKAVIPDSVVAIGGYAFQDCNSLTSVEISENVLKIETGAFSGCDTLEGIWVDKNNPNYCSDEKGVLFNKNKTELISCPGALAGAYTIPDSVATIGDSAFQSCVNLTSVTIPDGITTIGYSTFEACDSLISVTIPDSVTLIDEHAFESCGSLAYVTIPNSVTRIGAYAFMYCRSLTGVALGSGVKTIGYAAFNLCNSLTSVIIPDGVTTINEFVFGSCLNLTTVAIPASVTAIGNSAFDTCESLTEIYYGGSRAQWEKLDKGDNDFNGVFVHFNATRPWHPCPSGGFADVPIFSNWAHDGIDYCVAHELMNGTGGNLFNPNGTVSRAQLVTILYRMAGSPATAFKGAFTDVAEGLWYSDAIEWAAANGVVNGIGNGKFGPDQSITREQIATILHRYSGSPAVKGNLDSFPDKGSVSDFAKNGLIWATQEGLVNGVSSGGVTILAPKNNATRAQIAAIIMRYCERA